MNFLTKLKFWVTLKKLIQQTKKICKDIKQYRQNVINYKPEEDNRIKWKLAEIHKNTQNEIDAIKARYQKQMELL